MRRLTAILFAATLSLPSASFAFSPEDALKEAIANSPKFRETQLSVEQSQVQLQAQGSLRPLTLRAEGGLNYAQQPSSGVIEEGVRESTFMSASATLLQQFLYGTSVSLKLDFSRATARIRLTCPTSTSRKFARLGRITRPPPSSR
ncbi:MAG: hypothetical protein R3E66_03095 [bacterium]